MLTVAQLRAARTAARWTIEELARESGVSVRTIKTIEGREGDPGCRPQILQSLKTTLEAAGIEFIGSPDNNPGIRIRTDRQ